MTSHAQPPAYLIHGNLQTPAVWEPLLPALSLHKPTLIDLAQSQAPSLQAWAEAFCQRVRTESSGRPALLIAYSLGGRLALHALLHAPDLWAGAILCGAHPGSDDPRQREAWLAHDRRWAERFLTEPWGTLITEWDAQAVFGGIPNPCPPRECDFHREAIARQFENYSKGHQQALTPRLAQSTLPPVLTLSGEYDHTYTRLGQQLAAAHPNIQHQTLPLAHHRAPWEAPQAFAQATIRFLRQLPANVTMMSQVIAS